MPRKDPRDRLAYYREYHRKNKEKKNAVSRAWHQANREKALARNKRWQQENRERVRETQRAFYKKHWERRKAENLARYHRTKGQVKPKPRVTRAPVKGDPVLVAKRLLAKAEKLARLAKYGIIQAGNYNP